ncbi:hypothetical protein B1M71_15440, partial [Salmonella enterica subsp. enterica serovar Dublin]
RRILVLTFAWYFPLVDVMTGFYPCEAGINAINSDAFCVYSGDNARVKAFKLSAEFCHLRRRYARQARCRLTISAGSA